MRRLLWILLSVVIVVLLTVGGVYTWGREYIYPDGSNATHYTGGKQITEQIAKQYLLDPKAGGVPFFVQEQEIPKYKIVEYNITEVLPQTKLIYATGRVVRWESIEGSQDKYLVLAHDNNEAKYRVSMEDSDLFGQEKTHIVQESVYLPMFGMKSIEKKLERDSTIELGYGRLKLMVWRGDVVSILPVWDLPVMSKKDKNGEYLASKIIIRRVW